MTAIARRPVAGPRRSGDVAVEEAGEAGRVMGANGDLFEDPYACAVAHGGTDEVLQVDRGEVEGIEVVETDGLASDLELAVVAAVTPVGVPVADASHAE